MKKTHEKAKRYLRTVRKMNVDVDNEVLEMARLRALAEKINSHISEAKVQASGSQSRLEDTVLKLIEQEKKVSASVDKLMERQETIMVQIDGLDDEYSRKVLRMYFIDGARFLEIQKALKLYERAVYRYYDNGLTEFEKKYWEYF